jgi:hypothetical protein
MGDIDLKTLVLILALIVAVLLMGILLFMLRRHAPPQDAARLIYDQFCLKLARVGLRRHPSEGPLDFARRIGMRRKTLSTRVNEITRIYVRARYASEAEQIAALRQKVRAFRPRILLRKKR